MGLTLQVYFGNEEAKILYRVAKALTEGDMVELVHKLIREKYEELKRTNALEG